MMRAVKWLGGSIAAIVAVLYAASFLPEVTDHDHSAMERIKAGCMRQYGAGTEEARDCMFRLMARTMKESRAELDRRAAR